MKKIIVLLLIVLGVNFLSLASVRIMPKEHVSTFIQTNNIVKTNPTFIETYQKALKLNERRFKNLDKIQIGDTVLFPSQYGAFTEGWIATLPIKGVHDCIWRLTEKYLAGQLVTKIVPDVKPRSELVPEKSITPVKTVKGSLFGFGDFIFYLILLLIAGLFIWMMIRLIKSYFTKRELADADANQVIPGGLSDRPAVALEQINTAYPSRPRATKIQRVILYGPEGVSSVIVNMTFTDGIKRTKLLAGETAARVERIGNIVDFYRQHCGNLFGENFEGGYKLPLGWSWYLITPESELIITPETPETSGNSNIVSQPVGIPVTAVSLPTSEEIGKLLDSMRKNKMKPENMTYGSFQVTFRPKKEKEKKD